jgi:hypothetical protein
LAPTIPQNVTQAIGMAIAQIIFLSDNKTDRTKLLKVHHFSTRSMQKIKTHKQAINATTESLLLTNPSYKPTMKLIPIALKFVLY